MNAREIKMPHCSSSGASHIHRNTAVEWLKPRQKATVIPLRTRRPFCLMDDKRTYLMIHTAIGLALGASGILLLAAIYVRAWFFPSVFSLCITWGSYAAVTYYYHCFRQKTAKLFSRGLMVVSLTAGGTLVLLLMK